MIHIQLKLFVTLSKYLPENADNLPLADGTTIADLISDLAIPMDDVKLVFINGLNIARNIG